jgi:hypothetical protein
MSFIMTKSSQEDEIDRLERRFNELCNKDLATIQRENEAIRRKMKQRQLNKTSS